MTGSNFRIFYSHLAESRTSAELVKSFIQLVGVSGFVAHTGIDSGEIWDREIKRELDDCAALVALLHEGFSRRPYCNQEIGWASARRIPILPINFGENPQGMIASIQGSSNFAHDEEGAAHEIVKWLMKIPQLGFQIRKSTVDSLTDTDDYICVRFLKKSLERYGVAESRDIERIRNARITNPKFRSFYTVESEDDFENWLTKLSLSIQQNDFNPN